MFPYDTIKCRLFWICRCALRIAGNILTGNPWKCKKFIYFTTGFILGTAFCRCSGFLHSLPQKSSTEVWHHTAHCLGYVDRWHLYQFCCTILALRRNFQLRFYRMYPFCDILWCHAALFDIPLWGKIYWSHEIQFAGFCRTIILYSCISPLASHPLGIHWLHWHCLHHRNCIPSFRSAKTQNQRTKKYSIITTPKRRGLH